MLTILTLALLAQTSPAIRRSTPLSDDPGMVVRQVGTVTTNCLNCGVIVAGDGGLINVIGLDGGFIGSVYVDGGQLTAVQGPGQDGGPWAVYIEGGNLSVTSSASISFDGGSLGYMQMPDGGALQVYVVNPSGGSGGGGWVPDGGSIGSVVPMGGNVASSWAPDPAAVTSYDSTVVPTYDISGNLKVRAQVTTDEGAFSDGFPGTSLATNLTGSVTFTNGSATITGAGTAFMTEVTTNSYVKASGDGETRWVRVASIVSDTELTLERAYTGTSATTTGNRSNWVTMTPVGANFSVSASTVSMTNSLANNVTQALYRSLDYLPLKMTTRAAISARVANTTTSFAFVDALEPSTDMEAEFRFSGTDATQVECVTAFDSSGSNVTTVTIPGGGTTATQHSYEIDLGSDRVTFIIDGVLVATHQYEIPDSYRPMLYGVFIENSAPLGASTTVDVSWVKLESLNRLDVSVTNPVAARLQAQVQGGQREGAPITTNPVVIGGTDGAVARMMKVTTSGSVLVTGDKTNNLTTSDNTAVSTLPSVATSAAPSYSEGKMVAISTDLSGKVRTRIDDPVRVMTFDGGTTQDVSVTNFPAMWAPDGGFIGTVYVFNDGGITAYQGGTWNVGITGSVAVTGPATDAQLRATPLNVTVTNYDAGVWIASSALPTGAATSANQTTGNNSLSSLDTKTPALGQTTMAGSRPVVIASNQSTLNVNVTNYDAGVWIASMPAVTGTVTANQGGTWNINNVSGTVSLPTGASTSANQTTGNNSLSSIDTKTPALGQTTMAGSTPVTIASNQTAVPVSGTVAATQSGTWSVQQGAGQDGGVWAVSSTTRISTVNSTTTPLAANGTFTGSWENVESFGFMNLDVYSDQSTTDGLLIDWSFDGTNLDASDSYDVVGGTGRALAMPVRSRFIRLRYTNGSTPQSVFRLNLLFRQNGSPVNSHPVDWPVSHTSVATLSRSVIVGESTSGGGGYHNVKVNPSGALAAEVTQGTSPWAVSGTVAVSNLPATQPVSGTVTATVAFDGGAVTALQGLSNDGGTSWPVEVTNVVYAIILDGGSSGGGGGVVTQGGGQDGGAWAVYVVNPAAAGSTVIQGNGFDGGGTWGVWIEGGNLSVSSSVAFDGGSIGYMQMPDAGPLEVAIVSGTISIGTVGQGAGRDGGAWDVAGTVSVDNFPATQAVTQSGAWTVSQATGSNLHVVVDTAPTTTVTGTVAATQSGTWSTRMQDGAGNALASSTTTPAGTEQALIVRPIVSGTQTVSGTVAATQSGNWAVRNQDGSGNALASSTTAPAGTEQALIVRNIPSGTQTISGTVTANAGSGPFPVSDNGGSLTVDGTVAVSSVGGTVTVSGSVTADTELPAAASLADATANGSTTSVGSYLMGYNGTTWDRLRSTIAGGLLVNLSNASVPVTQSGTWNLTNISGTISLPTGAATETTLGTRLAETTFTGRFGAAGSLADTTANPSVTTIGAFGMVYNGTTWDRMRGSSTLGVSMNLTNIGGSAVTLGQKTSANSLPVVLSSDQSAVTVAQATAANLRTQTASEGTTGAALPTVASVMGGSDGTNTRIPFVYDVDTNGAATQYALGSSIVVPNFGGGLQITGQAESGGSIGLDVRPFYKLVATPTTTAVTCATTATLAPASALSSRTTITLYNNSNVTIYIGGSAVTTANGIPLAPGASFTDDVRSSPYYCRVASGTADLRVLEN